VFALRAARRFEMRERELGRWDEYGPRVESEPSPYTTKGVRMDWHLEVIGRWKGRVLRSRRPHEPPV